MSGEDSWKKEFMGSGGPNGSDRRGAGACRVGLADTKSSLSEACAAMGSNSARTRSKRWRAVGINSRLHAGSLDVGASLLAIAVFQATSPETDAPPSRAGSLLHK